MFAKLSEAFESSNPHVDYINKQQVYFDALPNMIVSNTSGLKGFDTAIQTVDTIGSKYQNHAIKQPNDIFMPEMSESLMALSRQCASSDIDRLISVKNQNSNIECGWLYSPPNKGSPYPILSKGFIGTPNAPLSVLNPPSYKKWYFDLHLAKKQMLIDKCKALKSCTDVDNDVFSGVCGYCTDTNTGIPVNNKGIPLYGNDPRGNCNVESIVTSSGKCPPPPPPGIGPQPIVDKTCDPINGRLSAACLYNQVIAGGCTDKGALAIALHGANNSNDYITSLRDGDAVKIYNRVANPSLNLDLFRQGQTTVNNVLQEVRQLSGNTSQSVNTAIGAASRDLCLQRGAIATYDICSELSDGSAAPFDLKCLQSIFQKMGGQPVGTMYPTNSNIDTYNSMGNIGAIKQYLTELSLSMNSNEYETQRESMIKLLGIRPEKMINRAPYTQGVEVFWFMPNGYTSVGGFLKRTIERNFFQYNASPSVFPQIGNVGQIAIVHLTDIRAPADASIKWNVTVDDAFYITVNQPSEYDETALQWGNVDKPGHFASMLGQAPTAYRANACTPFNASKPNITKVFFADGGGWGAFDVKSTACNGPDPNQSKYYSLTCEPRAPFLTYEVNIKTGIFEELRNPVIFGKLRGGTKGLDNHIRTDERNGVPGKKGFVRIKSDSAIDIPNIAFSGWKTMTIAFRLTAMPVKESLVHLIFGTHSANMYCSLIVTPLNGSTATATIEYNIGQGVKTVSTGSRMNLNTWFILGIHNNGVGFDWFIYDLEYLQEADGNTSLGIISIRGNGLLYSTHALWGGHERCTVMLGSGGFRHHFPYMYASSVYSFDIAWVHFFDKKATMNDIQRDCLSDWVYTQAPASYNSYSLSE